MYKYLNDDFLNLVRNQIPMRARKEILKMILEGIVYMHNRDIVHLGEPGISTLSTVKMNTDLL